MLLTLSQRMILFVTLILVSVSMIIGAQAPAAAALLEPAGAGQPGLEVADLADTAGGGHHHKTAPPGQDEAAGDCCLVACVPAAVPHVTQEMQPPAVTERYALYREDGFSRAFPQLMRPPRAIA
jgi:hypothetical protein